MWVRAASLVGILLCLLLSPKISTAQLASASATYTLRGTVINSVTGEPIQRVLVELSGNRQRHILTGADGKFEFENVPRGRTAVALRKPGFFPLQTRSRQGQPSWVTVGPDQPPAVLKMVPEAVISGHVMGDAGEPAESLPVQVFGEQIQDGRKTWSVVSSTQTDDLGEFRCANLQPGRYYVFAGPSSGPASFTPRPRAQARGQMRTLGGGRPAARGYPGVFYPAADSRESATLVEVKAGQHVETNFNVASQILHTISGTVSGYLTGNAGLNLEVTNSVGTQINANFDFDSERGTFRTQWLPPGHYALYAETRDNDGRGFYASLIVHLTSDLTGVHLQLLPSATIPVTFQVEKTRSDSPDIGLAVETRRRFNSFERRQGYVPASVVLTSVDNSPGKGQRQFHSQLGEGENAQSEIPGLPPGTYSVQVFANGPYYVASAQCGPVNVLEQNLTIAAGAGVPPIELVLRDDYGQLEAGLRLPAGAESALVIIIPDAAQRTQNFEVSRTFMTQLAPGTYHVLAVDRPDGFEYGDPDVLRKYADKGRQVTISANQKAKVELDVEHVED